MSNTPQGAVPPVVAATEAAVETPATTLDPKLEVYAKREKQLLQLKREIDAEKKAMAERSSKYDTDYIPKSRIKDDPFGALTELGLSYDDLATKLGEAPNMSDPTTRAIMSQLKATQDKLANIEKASQDAEKRQYDAALKQIDSEARHMVDSDPEFESVKAMGMHDAVTELIRTTFDSTGELLDVRVACAKVEEHLVEESYKVAQLSKVQSRMKAKETPAQVPQAATAGMKTLTNNLPSQPAKRSSEKERVARAIAAMKGELK